MLCIDLCAAFLLDLLIGDPEWFRLHPVRLIGSMVAALEKLTRKIFGNEYLAGFITVAVALTVSFSIVFYSLWLASKAGPIARHALNILWLYGAISARDLAKAGMVVYRNLKANNLPAARQSVSMLVSRETAEFDEAQASGSTIESVSENTLDGVISPVFFAVLGGAPLMWAFKAASTCDSMLGYKNERYLRFGFVAAKLDDALNYLPARLCLLIFPTAAALCGLSPLGSWRVGRRDAQNDDSPNSGIPEAAGAGAIGVKLGGPAVYHGVRLDKKPFGAEFPPATADHIRTAIRLMWSCVLVTLILALAADFALAIWLR